MKLITINDLGKVSNNSYFNNEDLVVINKTTPIETDTPVKLDCFLIIEGIEGEPLFNINQNFYHLTPSKSAFLLPGTEIQFVPEKGKSATTRWVAFSKNFLNDVIKLNNETWGLVMNLYKNPIIDTNTVESKKINQYRELLTTILQEPVHHYSKDIVRFLFSALFCEIIGHLQEQIENDQHSSDTIGRTAVIFKKFMQLVIEDDGSHRTVNYYANLLCYSPKHVSSSVKQTCGKSPLTIINEHAVEKIKIALKNSDLSVKELSDKFKFPNPSFFGKFVKKYIGMPPNKFRKDCHNASKRL